VTSEISDTIMGDATTIDGHEKLIPTKTKSSFFRLGTSYVIKCDICAKIVETN
jgi:hypothetical protein